MSKYRLINRLSKPDGTETAHAQSLNTEPYKPVYATEAYEADVQEAIEHFNDSDTWSFRNPNVAQRAISVREKLNDDVPIDKDHPYGENAWFIEQCRSINPPIAPTNYLKFTFDPTLSSNTIKLEHGENIQESWNGETWEDYTVGQTMTTQSGQTTWYFRGKSGSTPVYGFHTTAIKVEGSIMALVDYENVETVTIAPQQFCKTTYGSTTKDEAGLFYGTTSSPFTACTCPNLADASQVGMPDPSQMKTTSEYAFHLMFHSCTALTTEGLPTLTCPAIAKSAYDCMFYGCTALTSIPNHYLDNTFTPTPGVAPYSFMFFNCTGLTSLPDTLLNTPYLGECIYEDDDWCYQSAYTEMFAGCTGLVDVSNLKLPATTLTPCCYGHMFKDCTSLTGVPTLPATTLVAGCYKGMFNGCKALTVTPVLSANDLPDGNNWSSYYSGQNRGCYQEMFSGCTSLTTAPDLPATVIGSYCYVGMFQSCTALTHTPNESTDYPCGILPATYMKMYAYSDMFNGCTSLVYAPDLPATSLAAESYRRMFSGCTSLRRVKCLAISGINNCTQWLGGCNVTDGVFFGDETCTPKYGYAATIWTVGAGGDNDIPSGWWYNPLKFSGDSFTHIALAKGADISYSTDEINWQSYTLNTEILSQGKNVYFRGESKGTPVARFSGDFEKVEGNVLALLDKAGQTITYADYQFLETTTNSGLFSDCASLKDASNLSLVYGKNGNGSLSISCYQGMFKNCVALVHAPALHAQKFSTTCYSNMFYACKKLVTAPAIFANDIESGAIGCCSWMFQLCSGLRIGPTLYLGTLTNDIYCYMFYGCTSLETLQCEATDISASNCTVEWVDGVSTTTGLFTGKSSMAPGSTGGWTRGSNGVPSFWDYQGI